MIAGGGTGGHIYPAVAIGRALMKLDDHCEVRFVGTADGLEQKIMAREKLPLDLISSGKLNFKGRFFQKLKTMIKIPYGLLQSFVLIWKHQPGFVLGVGGYASAPFLLAAVFMRKKVAVWEPNAHPGMANRLLSRLVPKAYLVFDEAKKYLSCREFQVFGMPLRAEMDEAQEQNLSSEHQADRLTILCFGGSQGSLFLNEKISDFILSHPELHDQIFLIHQTGSLGFSAMKQKYGDLKCVEVHEFIYDMPKYYRQADIQFCRGGASTIAEAAAFGVVPLVVPLPAADDHQEKNAEVLVKNQAGFLFKQNQFDEQQFFQTILKLKNNLEYRKQMAQNLKKIAPFQAATEIAKDILKQIL